MSTAIRDPFAPAPARAPAPPTYADIEALPPHVVGEILGGELVVSPRPAAPHARASTTLGTLVSAAFDLALSGPGGWWIAFEPELSLGVDPRFDPVVPDIAGWRREALPEHPLTPQFHAVPNWICEVSSPTTQRSDRVLKLPFYARAGVGHVWILDPLARTLEVFRLVDGAWQLAAVHGGDEVVRAAPFEALSLPLASLWVPEPVAPADAIERPDAAGEPAR
jgi:Uma2 family endonuclease